MKRAQMSFDEKRQAVLKIATAECKDGITRQVTFANRNIASFLRDLRRFQAASRKQRLFAK